MTRLTLLLTLFAGFPTVANAQTGNPAVVVVELSNFKFSPHAIRLKAGVPVVLRLQNSAAGGHNFTAPQFFRAAKMTPATANLVRNGTVEIAKQSTVDVDLVPSSGSYRLKCSHTLHSGFGMKGLIRVE